MLMLHMLIILTLTLIQGHTDLNPVKCLIIQSETIQAIIFAVKMVLLKVYMTFASPMTMTFSNLATF